MSLNQTAHAIWSAIQKAKSIIILRHIFPDADALGSSFGLYYTIKKHFPEKIVWIPGDNISRFTFLGKNDRFSDTIDWKNSLVIVTDTANQARIDIDDIAHLKQAKQVIKIDHHPGGENYGALDLTSAQFCSASEATAWLLKTNGLVIDEQISRTIYAGIVGDTNRLEYATVSAETMNTCGWLMAQGLNLFTFYEQYYQQSEAILKYKLHLLEQLKIYDQQLVVCLNQPDVLQPLGLDRFTANEYIDELAHIGNSQMWMLFSQDSIGGPIVGIFRSLVAPVNSVASQYGGGGHANYAGVTLQSWTEVEDMIISYRTFLKSWATEHVMKGNQ